MCKGNKRNSSQPHQLSEFLHAAGRIRRGTYLSAEKKHSGKVVVLKNRWQNFLGHSQIIIKLLQFSSVSCHGMRTVYWA